MNLIGFSIRRPVTTVMFYVALMILGMVSLSKMSTDLFPAISFPTISINTRYSGAGPEEIERLITIPIERAVATVNRLESITSTSEEERSRVRVHFAWGTDLETAANDIRANLDRVRRRLPDGADTPTVFKFDSTAMPIMTLGLSGEMDEGDLRDLAEDDLSYQLQKIPGVASVEVRGGRGREIRVTLKQSRLQALGITVDQISNVINAENSNLPAGYLAVGPGDFLLRTLGEFRSLDEIRNIVITVRHGVPVYLKDLATIEECLEDIRSLVRIDGKPGIVLSIQKQSDANTVDVADRVYKVMEELRQAHRDIQLRIINDNSTYIRSAVGSVSNSALVGGLLAAFVLLFFLHNFRATIITGIVMPISILATFILAYFGKMTLNTISLGGLALGVGMLVDNSVVVLDNIFRIHQHNGRDIGSAALEGTVEMTPAITASTLTTICVFFPMIYISGRAGIVYKELSFMVIFSLICSLVVAITLIPMLCSKFLRSRDLNQAETGDLKGYLFKIQNQWEDSYEKLLEWCLAHKTKALAIGVLIFLSSISLWPLLGTELVQTTDEGVISVRINLPEGTRLEETDSTSKLVEDSISAMVSELEHMEASVYSGRADLTLRLKSRAQRGRSTQDVVKLLQQRLKIPGARIRIREQNSMRMLYGGSQYPIDIDIRGYDQETAKQVADLVMERLSKIPGIGDVTFSQEEKRPELNVQIDRKRAADLGISAVQIGKAIQGNIEGDIATIYRKDGEEYDVRVYLEEADRSSWQDLRRILVSGAGGQTVPLMSLVEIVQGNSPTAIERKDQERNMTVSASLAGRDLSSVMKDIRAELSKLTLPSGISIYYAGDYEEQQKSSQEILTALILALALVYMVMAAQFESFLDPFIIMFSVPFALGGVILALFITDTNINTQVYIGLIMLGGVVVNNAIVLISYYRILMERGAGLAAAVLKGSCSRLRPILMTTITTTLGLLPLALGMGEGSETQTPLARTVIGGLTFSTILALIIIPVIFAGIEEMLQKIKRRRRNAAIGLGVLVLFCIMAVVSLPIQAAEAQKITIDDAVALAMENSETGKIIRLKRKNAESVYVLDQSDKKLKVYSEADASDADGKESSGISIIAEKSVPLKNLVGIKSLADLVNESNRKISLMELEMMESNLIQEVIIAYQKEMLAKKDLELAEDNLERSRRFYNEIMAKSKLGMTSIIDEVGAEARFAEAETSVNRYRQLYRLARIGFCQLIGIDPNPELKLEPVELTMENKEFNLETIRGEAWSGRPDLKIAQEELGRTENLLKLARLSKRAGITLNWSVDKDDYQTGLALTNQNANNVSDEWRLKGSVGAFPYQDPDRVGTDPEPGTFKLSLKWDLFDGKARRERVKQAEILFEQKKIELSKLEKEVDYDVEEAVCNYQYLVDEVKNGAVQVRSKRIYLDAMEAKLKLGLVSVKEVLDAQADYHKAQVDYERYKSELYLAEIELLRVTGKLKLEIISNR